MAHMAAAQLQLEPVAVAQAMQLDGEPDFRAIVSSELARRKPKISDSCTCACPRTLLA